MDGINLAELFSDSFRNEVLEQIDNIKEKRQTKHDELIEDIKKQKMEVAKAMLIYDLHKEMSKFYKEYKEIEENSRKNYLELSEKFLNEKPKYQRQIRNISQELEELETIRKRYEQGK